MNTAFIELTLGSYIISHGYDSKRKEHLEHVPSDKFSKKLVAINRIKSVSEKYILTDYIDGRWIYWEYLEDYEAVKKRLQLSF
ncbi:hypothetical protein KFZ70_08535 [Tamlana fucoidanivorans]|uniref:Uncharacterized protein n=1 Tax=Allotamlana fucoidanivorans TaxID=2583814 RepID=A0A5C4SQA2_9FLAO|nr:hypothetical protein [Tamlana fucoidanivorans]TNJ46193.1 hypothetical protein FGF67_04145 [Tamlana fucoidanivorans]